jgi:hypothetical protein
VLQLETGAAPAWAPAAPVADAPADATADSDESAAPSAEAADDHMSTDGVAPSDDGAE